jgi:DnaK suppressor protein
MKRASGSNVHEQILLQFRCGLRNQQRELQRSIEQAEKDLCSLVDPGPLDPIDACTDNLLKESLCDRSSENRGQLRLVEAALERIRDGSFGTCAACEGAISLKRLQVLPWARLCIQCQGQLERGELNTGELSSDCLAAIKAPPCARTGSDSAQDVL